VAAPPVDSPRGGGPSAGHRDPRLSLRPRAYPVPCARGENPDRLARPSRRLMPAPARPHSADQQTAWPGQRVPPRGTGPRGGGVPRRYRRGHQPSTIQDGKSRSASGPAYMLQIHRREQHEKNSRCLAIRNGPQGVEEHMPAGSLETMELQLSVSTAFTTKCPAVKARDTRAPTVQVDRVQRAARSGAPSSAATLLALVDHAARSNTRTGERRQTLPETVIDHLYAGQGGPAPHGGATFRLKKQKKKKKKKTKKHQKTKKKSNATSLVNPPGQATPMFESGGERKVKGIQSKPFLVSERAGPAPDLQNHTMPAKWTRTTPRFPAQKAAGTGAFSSRFAPARKSPSAQQVLTHHGHANQEQGRSTELLQQQKESPRVVERLRGSPRQARPVPINWRQCNRTSSEDRLRRRSKAVHERSWPTRDTARRGTISTGWSATGKDGAKRSRETGGCAVSDQKEGPSHRPRKQKKRAERTTRKKVAS